MSSRRLCPFLLMCLALAGCGAGVRTLQHASEEPVSLELRTLEGDVRVVVPGTLGASPVAWMLDTGASWHTLDAGDARERGLLAPVPSGSVIWVDVTVPLSVSVFRGEMEVGALGVASDHPDDVVGILSPQRLVGDGAIELDLARGALSRLTPRVARAASDEVAGAGARLATCRDDAGRSVPVVDGTVDGHAVRLLVDTGSPITLLFTDTEAGAFTSLGTTTHYDVEDGAFGSSLAIVPAARISVAGVTTTQRMGIIDRPGVLPDACEVDGLLGLDVLRGCTLVLSDAGDDTDAMACGSAPALDTSPALTRMTPVVPPTPLAARAPALPSGVAARIGCATVTEAEVATSSFSPTAEAREGYLRGRAFEHYAAEIHAEVDDADVDRAVEELRARHGAADFEAGLAAQNMTLDALRAALRLQLIAMRVAARVGLDGEVLATRLRDRYARVVTEGTGARCYESWPAYFLDETVLVGLTPTDERAVRLSLARALRGGAVTLGAVGILPPRWTAAVEEVFAQRGLVPQLEILAEGRNLEVRVTLAPE